MLKNIKAAIFNISASLSREKGISQRDSAANTEIINQKKQFEEFHGTAMFGLKQAKEFVDAYNRGEFAEAVDKFREEAEAIESDEIKRNKAAQRRVLFLSSLDERESDMALWDGKKSGPMDRDVDDDMGLDKLRDVFADQGPYEPEPKEMPIDHANPMSEKIGEQDIYPEPPDTKCTREATNKEIKFGSITTEQVMKLLVRDDCLKKIKIVISDEAPVKGFKYYGANLDKITSEDELQVDVYIWKVDMATDIWANDYNSNQEKTIEIRDLQIVQSFEHFNLLRFAYREKAEVEATDNDIVPERPEAKLNVKEMKMGDDLHNNLIDGGECLIDIIKEINEVCNSETKDHTVKMGNVEVTIPEGRPELHNKVKGWWKDELPNAHDHDGIPCSFECASHAFDGCPKCGKAWPCKNIHDGISEDKSEKREASKEVISDEEAKLKQAVTSYSTPLNAAQRKAEIDAAKSETTIRLDEDQME